MKTFRQSSLRKRVNLFKVFRMHKRPFILMELMIALSLLSIAFLPLLGTPFFYLKKHKKNLLELELERESEEIFYEILTDFRKNFPEWNFCEEYNTSKKLLPRKITIDGLDLITVFPHYHIYHHKPHDANIDSYPLHCTICFNLSNDTSCPFVKQKNNPQNAIRGKINKGVHMCFPLGLRVERVKNK